MFAVLQRYKPIKVSIFLIFYMNIKFKLSVDKDIIVYIMPDGIDNDLDG